MRGILCFLIMVVPALAQENPPIEYSTGTGSEDSPNPVSPGESITIKNNTGDILLVAPKPDPTKPNLGELLGPPILIMGMTGTFTVPNSPALLGASLQFELDPSTPSDPLDGH